MLGMIYEVSESVAFGYGIAAYGLTYFLVHEIFIHQRFRFLRNTTNPYFKAVRLKHKLHHKNLDQHGAEHFGLLWVSLELINSQRTKKQS
jgi:beta-carotene 3-hydroxylase